MKELHAIFTAFQPKRTHIQSQQLDISPQPLKPVKFVSEKLPGAVSDFGSNAILRLRRLGAQAEHINELSQELETAIKEFKAIAEVVNWDMKTVSTKSKSFSTICEYQAAAVPFITQKPSGSLVLSVRKVDLFKAERDAALVAQTLRRRAKRKRTS